MKKGDRLLSRDELRELKGIDYSRSRLHELMRDGQFSKSVPLADAKPGAGGAKSARLESEIDAWMAARVRARDEREAA